jgi:hypothetical protein
MHAVRPLWCQLAALCVPAVRKALDVDPVAHCPVLLCPVATRVLSSSDELVEEIVCAPAEEDPFAFGVA